MVIVNVISDGLDSIPDDMLCDRFGGGGIDRCLDSIAVGTLRDRVMVGSITFGRMFDRVVVGLIDFDGSGLGSIDSELTTRTPLESNLNNQF